jgi:hypothetical protein
MKVEVEVDRANIVLFNSDQFLYILSAAKLQRAKDLSTLSLFLTTNAEWYRLLSNTQHWYQGLSS